MAEELNLNLDLPIEESPPRAFSQVGTLLSRSDLWAGWLAQYPDRADLFKDAFSCVVRLKSHTGWSDDEILEGLGCDTKTEDELSSLSVERLRHCLNYMLWVESLLGQHDLDLDKRLIVRGAARFFVAADRDLDRVRALMDAGEFSPSKYLALGEVAEAWRSARRLLDGPAGDRARRLRNENPFVDESTPHMGPMRLKMLTRSDADKLLGPRVTVRMREHLEFCHVCAAAAQGPAAGPTDSQRAAAGPAGSQSVAVH